MGGNPHAFLREYFSALEEARADLVALYFLPDPKIVELGLVPEAAHADILLAGYESYSRNALVQLRRIREGSQIEEDHMRNRQLIVHWLIANNRMAQNRPGWETQCWYTNWWDKEFGLNIAGQLFDGVEAMLK